MKYPWNIFTLTIKNIRQRLLPLIMDQNNQPFVQLSALGTYLTNIGQWHQMFLIPIELLNDQAFYANEVEKSLPPAVFWSSMSRQTGPSCGPAFWSPPEWPEWHLWRSHHCSKWCWRHTSGAGRSCSTSSSTVDCPSETGQGVPIEWRRIAHQFT